MSNKYRTGEFADRLGRSVSTVQRWETLGRITGRRTLSGQRWSGDADVRTFTLTDGGDVWLAVPGLLPRTSVAVPLNTTVAPSGTLRLILRDGRAEVHYQVDGTTLRSSGRPHGDQVLGVDKGYTEVLTDSDGERHGPGLGALARHGDPDITLYTPHKRVRQILRERADRHRTRLPVPDSSPVQGGERKIRIERSCAGMSNE